MTTSGPQSRLWESLCCHMSFTGAFHGFGQAKYPDGGSVLGSSQFSILPRRPPKILLNLKVVKINPKIIILLP